MKNIEAIHPVAYTPVLAAQVAADFNAAYPTLIEWSQK